MPKKKDAFYFPHDANARNDEKMIELRIEMGYEGYALYFAVLEVMRENNTGDDAYKLKTERLTERLSLALGVGSDLLKAFFSNAKECGLFVEENGLIFSNSFVERMEYIDSKRRKCAENGKLGGRPRKKPNAKPLGSDSLKPNESKEKKEKETKEKFDEFFNAYAKRQKEKEAFEVWKTIDSDIYDTIIKAAKAYAPTVATMDRKRFQPQAANWLTDERWNDEIEKTPEQLEAEAAFAPEASNDEIRALLRASAEAEQEEDDNTPF
jgi:hypothetical protein